MMPSTLGLGSSAPDFDLLGVDGRRYSLQSFKAKPVLVVIFSCNHCPYVKDYESRMVAIQRDYQGRGVQLIAINSNDDKAYPEDSFPEMVKRAKDKGFNFPYLRDDTQRVVEAYGGVCTPHVFAFDGNRKLRYRGRIDDSRDPSKVASSDLRNAVDDLLKGADVRVPDTRPFGCSIKWYSVKPA
ncbi:MAG TPA: thioredoxin family protein [Nitrososphaerales archaeon]|nr:thioredoxin family protein [Nitrososphaerales archaeon]